MTVRGIGIDLVRIPRMREVISRWEERFLRRVFTDAEIAYCRSRRDPVPHFAARFAAKEAVGKALGIGMTRWHEVEVTRGRGAPGVRLTGRCARRAEALGVERVHLSLTHGRDEAIAVAVLEGGAG